MAQPTRMCAAALVLGAGGAQAQAPLQPGFDLSNSSDSAITQVYAKPEGSPNWGSPLATTPLTAGATETIKVPSETNCFYQVRLVFRDGRTQVHDKVDVCKHERINIRASR